MIEFSKILLLENMMTINNLCKKKKINRKLSNSPMKFKWVKQQNSNSINDQKISKLISILILLI